MREDTTHEYYETHADEYFQATHAADLHPMWRNFSQHLQTNALILDLGCGSGRDMRHFAQQGFRVVGVDYSSKLLQLAQSFTRQPLVLGNFVHLPFQNQTFDAVWSIGALLHVPRLLLPSVLAQIHTVLKPDSVFFTAMKKGTGEGVDDLGRFHVFYQPREWKDILTENGYEVLEIRESSELREVGPNDIREIIWIECLARTVLKEKTFGLVNGDHLGTSW